MEAVRSRAVASRRAAAVAAAIILAATVARMLTLDLAADRLSGEVALSAAAVLCAALSLRLPHDPDLRDALVAGQGVAAALVAGGMLALSAGHLDHAPLIAVLLFTAISLAAPPQAGLRARVAVAVAAGGTLAAVWLSWLDGDVPTLLVAIAFIGALQLVVLAHDRSVWASAEAWNARSSAHAATAERVGTAIDVLGVTRAVLETTRQRYPMATHAAIFLHDAGADRLRPIPLYLTPDGIGLMESDNLDFTLAPGEGLAGKVFATSRPLLWQTAHDVHLAQADLGEQVRSQALALRRGVTRCAIGAPLVVDDEVIGACVITSNRQELVWSDDDLTVVAAHASEAARAIERARRSEREIDQAHLDSITGLANHRQLIRILDKEVARARRQSSPLGVVFCDLDLFKVVNDTYGHATGDRVLTLLADVFHDSLRLEDSAARYGGDEFVCVLPGADRAETDAVGRRISSTFEARVREDTELGSAGLTISCGVAIFPDDANDADSLLQLADAAMRRVKMGRRAGLPSGLRPA